MRSHWPVVILIGVVGLVACSKQVPATMDPAPVASATASVTASVTATVPAATVPVAVPAETVPAATAPLAVPVVTSTATTTSSASPLKFEQSDASCQILADVRCRTQPCPEGYRCSGITKFKCFRGQCALPACLSETARIATPDGEVAVSDVREGMIVFTTDEAGRRTRAPVARVGRAFAPAGHRMVHVKLDDSREVWASPQHPTASGAPVASLRTGAAYDGAIVVAVSSEPYGGAYTYDLLPAGPTGTYWADGVLLGSTLRDVRDAGSAAPGAPHNMEVKSAEFK